MQDARGDVLCGVLWGANVVFFNAVNGKGTMGVSCGVCTLSSRTLHCVVFIAVFWGAVL